MKIKVQIGSPVYEKIQVYGKPHPIKRIKDECKKYILLDVVMANFTPEVSRQIYDKIYEEMNKKYDNILTLSQCGWGEVEEYDKDGYFKERICIPKDFDRLEEQKKELLKEARDIIRRIKKILYNKLPYVVECDMEGHRGVRHYNTSFFNQEWIGG